MRNNYAQSIVEWERLSFAILLDGARKGIWTFKIVPNSKFLGENNDQKYISAAGLSITSRGWQVIMR